MPLPPPRADRSPNRLATVALVVGAVSFLAVIVVVLVTLFGGARPEEDVAATFVSAVLDGDGATAYELTTPGYRTLVTGPDLDALADAIAAVAGPDADLDILGSERTPGAPYGESLVGYQAATDAGVMEGVVTLVQRVADGPWEVRDLSFRFPDAPESATADLRELTTRLNAQLSERAATLTTPDGG